MTVSICCVIKSEVVSHMTVRVIGAIIHSLELNPCNAPFVHFIAGPEDFMAAVQESHGWV